MNVEITGAKILLRLPFGILITETQVNMWIIMLVIAILCKWLTHNLKVKPEGKRQVVAEYLVNMSNKFVISNMGDRFKNFPPFIGTLFAFSLLCNLSGLLGMYPPTADLNTTLGWAIVTFVLIVYYKIKANGLGGYFKGFMEPIPVLAPFNILGEFSTPISMAIRMFGNVSTGVVISTLVYAALAWLSSLVLQWLPGVLSNIPILQLGIPAVLSIYFDLFSGALQSFIFCMLTVLYIAQASKGD